VKTAYQILAVLLGCLVLAAGVEAQSHADADRVRLIMSNLPPRGSPAYQAVRERAGEATGQALPMTKSEMWSVAKGRVKGVREAAAAHGVGVRALGRDWNHVFHPAPADIRLTTRQKAMIERVLAAKATQAIRLVIASAPSVVEYALTAEAANKGAAAAITLTLGAGEALTIMRRAIDMRRDMCVWRGRVAGSGSPATLMWWPHGKIAGSVQHADRLYSIRYLGGELHALVEMREERMPNEHPPPPSHKR
jgi:hypothetical protein